MPRTERAVLKEAARLIRSQLGWFKHVDTSPGAEPANPGSQARLAQRFAKWLRDFEALPLPEPPPPPKKTCKKVAYRKRKQAEAAALDLEAQGRGPLEPYRCTRCLRFHLTSRIPKNGSG